MRRRSLLLLSIACVVAVAASGGGSAASTGATRSCGWKAQPSKRIAHVVWIWLENKSYGDVIGSDAAPFLNQLAARCGLATNYSAITHPSLPNYVAATSGTDSGITDDGAPDVHRIPGPSIFSQVQRAGLTWRAYAETMPRNCDPADAGAYIAHHNPPPYYTSLASTCVRWDVPLSQLRVDRLPAFAFVAPNQCNDMHSCPISTGDRWARSWVGKILAGAAYRSGTTAVFVTWDEGNGSDNQVATIVVSPTTKPGTRSSTAFDHYSLLKTTEELLGLPLLGHAADRATLSMRRAFHL